MALPAPAVGSVFLVTLHGSLFNQMILNTFYFQITIVGSEQDIGTYAQNLFNKLNTAGGVIPAFLASQPPQYQLIECWVQQVFPVRFRKFVFNVGSPGVFASNTLTSNLAVTITRTGDLANKHNRGSLHIVCASQDAGMSNGIISNNMGVVASTLATRIVGTVTTTALTAALFGLWPKKATLATQFAPVTSAIVEDTVRVMRRRTVGVGK